MTSKTKFDLIAKSLILRSEKPNKGLDAIASNNPNQMNRIVAYLDSGEKVVVAQRAGKGGMDFNKILGGKVYAVAADGVSPVFEKVDGKPSKTQKTEDGLPLYSSSGFYLLSSKEYPALDLMSCYTRLINNGEHVLLVTDAQLKESKPVRLESELDLDMLPSLMEDMLSDEHNLVTRFDLDANKRRRRGIERAKEEADDNDETYTGVAFKELSASKKDGNPFLLVSIALPSGEYETAIVLREAVVENPDYDDGRSMTQYYTAQEAALAFTSTTQNELIKELIDQAGGADVIITRGHVMRTSVSFRRKVENVREAPPEKRVYGDAVYIDGASKHWCKGIVTLMHSMHPNFPTADYEAHHYVAAVRQAEVGMVKNGDRWTPPVTIATDVVALQLDALKA